MLYKKNTCRWPMVMSHYGLKKEYSLAIIENELELLHKGNVLAFGDMCKLRDNLLDKRVKHCLPEEKQEQFLKDAIDDLLYYDKSLTMMWLERTKKAYRLEIPNSEDLGLMDNETGKFLTPNNLMEKFWFWRMYIIAWSKDEFPAKCPLETEVIVESPLVGPTFTITDMEGNNPMEFTATLKPATPAKEEKMSTSIHALYSEYVCASYFPADTLLLANIFTSKYKDYEVYTAPNSTIENIEDNSLVKFLNDDKIYLLRKNYSVISDRWHFRCVDKSPGFTIPLSVIRAFPGLQVIKKPKDNVADITITCKVPKSAVPFITDCRTEINFVQNGIVKYHTNNYVPTVKK